MGPLIVYFSSPTGNTKRFVDSLEIDNVRIPVSAKEEFPTMTEPYVLVSPTYAHEDGSRAVPKQVIKFLNISQNREWLQGVIGSGNRNFGEYFALAGQIIAKKCNVPLLYRFELSGTSTDIKIVKEGVKKLWRSLMNQQNKTQGMK